MNYDEFLRRARVLADVVHGEARVRIELLGAEVEVACHITGRYPHHASYYQNVWPTPVDQDAVLEQLLATAAAWFGVPAPTAEE